eukprot:1817310-Amphidinium_carterae.1
MKGVHSDIQVPALSKRPVQLCFELLRKGRSSSQSLRASPKDTCSEASRSMPIRFRVCQRLPR